MPPELTYCVPLALMKHDTATPRLYILCDYPELTTAPVMRIPELITVVPDFSQTPVEPSTGISTRAPAAASKVVNMVFIYTPVLTASATTAMSPLTAMT